MPPYQTIPSPTDMGTRNEQGRKREKEKSERGKERETDGDIGGGHKRASEAVGGLPKPFGLRNPLREKIREERERDEGEEEKRR